MSRTMRVLAALLAGVGVGWAVQGFDLPGRSALEQLSQLIGGLWLDALKMTILPLIASLLIVGVCETAEQASGSRLALRVIVLIATLLVAVTLLSAILTPLLLSLWPAPSLGLHAGGPVAYAVVTPPDLIRSLLPPNIFQAAAEGSVLAVVVFCVVFAIGMTHVELGQRRAVVDFFRACGNGLLKVVDGVLWLAPAGVFGLACLLGLRTGGAALGGLAHYVAVVCLIGTSAWGLAYVFAGVASRTPFLKFVRAMLPAQAVALSTQSSIAALPSMIAATEGLGVRKETAAVALPLAVALFRITSPSMNLAVAIYVAHVLGVDLSIQTLAVGVCVALLTTIGSVGLPGQASFLTSITPIAVAMGLPIEPLVIFLAIEMIPDLVRTVGNVTADVALAAVADRDRPVGDEA